MADHLDLAPPDFIYSLITFDNAAPTQRQIRRQSTAPLVYNVTLIFAASAGTSYTLTAWAAVVITGNDKPDCSITICGNNYCSSPFPLTTSYIGFSYNYQSLVDEGDAVATFQVQCASSAYVALDDISVTNNLLAASASSAQAISTATTTVFRTETETLHITQTLPSGTETQQITQTLSPVTETIQITQTLPEVTQTLPQITETLPITQTLEITQYGPTITETYSSTSIPDFSTTFVDEPSSSSEPAVTLVQEPTSTVEEPSYSSVYVPPPPSGVPAVALARPTAVVGDFNGSPVSVDDVAYSVRIFAS